MIIGFDPGRDKCGIAISNQDRQILSHQIIAAEDAIATIVNLCNQYQPQCLVMGNQTTSKQWQEKLIQELQLSIPIVLVDERNSTVEARKRYWEMYSAKGLQKLIPLSLRIPPRPVDDIVAILLIERYFAKN